MSQKGILRLDEDKLCAVDNLVAPLNTSGTQLKFEVFVAMQRMVLKIATAA